MCPKWINHPRRTVPQVMTEPRFSLLLPTHSLGWVLLLESLHLWPSQAPESIYLPRTMLREYDRPGHNDGRQLSSSYDKPPTDVLMPALEASQPQGGLAPTALPEGAPRFDERSLVTGSLSQLSFRTPCIMFTKSVQCLHSSKGVLG